MVPHFILDVEPDAATAAVILRLQDADGTHLAHHQVRLGDHPASLWEGLFSAREHVRRYQNTMVIDGQSTPASAAQLVERLGRFLGQHVLGPAIMDGLAQQHHHRVLEVRLPAPGVSAQGPAQTAPAQGPSNDDLAAAFARVPWEIARPPGGETLQARNVAVRAVNRGGRVQGAPIPLPVDSAKPVRVLLVFAEAPGTNPLAARLERRRLLEKFYRDILPGKNVQVDVLCHGVTRQVLSDQVREAGGYHILHWSGHGNLDRLALLKEDGEADLDGDALVQLLADAGGYIPHLVFLSACHSGAVVHDWESLRESLRGESTRQGRPGPGLAEGLRRRPGYAGTALSLLRAGVPQVVAMRFEVGDVYARALAVAFYGHLLADSAQHSAESALLLARKELHRSGRAGFDAADHATPLIFGAGQPLPVKAGHSEQLDRLRPRPQPLLRGSAELDAPASFVGRGAELARLARRWLPGAHLPTGQGPVGVALVQGLAGMGKTSLAAEAIDLWHRRFGCVLAFTCKPNGLSLQDFYRQAHQRLLLASGAYRRRCDEQPYEKVYLEAEGELTGAALRERLRTNLVEVLRAERVLVVLDNFESQLLPVGAAAGYLCGDPAWDELLRELAAALPETGSRVLVTSRHRLAALGAGALWLPLGPLPMAEARLYLQEQPALLALAHGDQAGQELSLRLLTVSRGHPLILSRLGTLAAERAGLAAALDGLERRGLQRLPDLFAQGKSEAEREQERAYLEDVAQGSVDLLLRRATELARRLLWTVALAGEPVAEALLQGVWSGLSIKEEMTQWLRELTAQKEELPAELRAKLDNMPDEMRAALAQAQMGPPPPPMGPLLQELRGAGLLVEELDGEQTVWGCHELVRERVAAWMEDHGEERGERTQEQVWVAYGERYAAVFEHLQVSGKPKARDQAAEAGRRAVTSFIRARAFQQLGTVATVLVTGTADPALLHRVIGDLRLAAEQAPPGEARWRVRSCMADALRGTRQPELALPLYAQAAQEAEAAEHWWDVGWICQNWANALGDCGHLDKAKAAYQRSADADQKAGAPRIGIICSELESLRIDVMLGHAEQAWPEVESRLAEICGWWKRHQGGESVAEAPEPVLLGRAYVSALDIAEGAHRVLNRWADCFDLLDEIEAAKRALGEGDLSLAQTRFNKYGLLLRLQQFSEAQKVLEECLDLFRAAGVVGDQAGALVGLADLRDKLGDHEQAVSFARQSLSLCNSLPDPSGRAISHNNLASYLARLGLDGEAARHYLAAIAYFVGAGLKQSLQTPIHFLAVRLAEAAQAGSEYHLPRLADLLSRPEFATLRQFLDSRGISPESIQAAIDQLVAQVRAAVAQELPAPVSPAPPSPAAQEPA